MEIIKPHDAIALYVHGIMSNKVKPIFTIKIKHEHTVYMDIRKVNKLENLCTI